MTDVDITQLVTLAADFRSAGRDIISEVRPAVSKGALNIKKTMQKDMSGSTYFGQVAPTIGYDLSGNATYSEAEIGAYTGGKVPGDLAHLAYFGGARGGGGTVRDPQAAADEEAPRFEQAISAVIGRLL